MKRLRAFFLTGAGFLILAEIALRLLPVSQGFYLDDITVDQPVARRLPDRHGVSSVGWSMTDASRVWINGQGFIYHRDFDRETDEKRIVIIGDSQIEAPLIPTEVSLAKTMERNLNDRIRVFPVGMSGAPLSQYLVWYQYMRETYDPELVIFVISPNDYDESFEAYGLFPGFHYFSENPDGGISLRLREYRRTLFSRIASSSDLAAYLLNNLGLMTFLKAQFRKIVVEDQRALTRLEESAAPSPSTDTSDTSNDQRFAAGLQAIKLFFERLDQGERSRPEILFLMAPENQGAYSNSEFIQPDSTRYSRLGEALRSAASSNGYTAADLKPVFHRDFENCGFPLEFSNDVHWSVRGQAVVANMLSVWLSHKFGFDASAQGLDCQK